MLYISLSDTPSWLLKQFGHTGCCVPFGTGDQGLVLGLGVVAAQELDSVKDKKIQTRPKQKYHKAFLPFWVGFFLIQCSVSCWKLWLFSRVLIKSVLTVGACYFDVSASRMWLGTWNCLQGHFLSQTLFSCSCSLENPQKTFPSTNSAHCEGKRCSVTGQSIFLISMAVASAFVTLLSVHLLPK